MSDRAEALKTRLQYLILARLGVATLLLGGSLVLLGEGSEPGGFTPTALRTLIVATYAASLVFSIALSQARDLQAWAGAQLAWDLVLVSGLVYLFGGAGSGFAFLYGVSILAAALVVGPRSTQAVTASAIILYTSIGLALAYGWLPAPDDQGIETVSPQSEELGLALLRTLLGLVLTGVLALLLADRIRRTGGRLVRAERSAAGYARLTEDILRSLASGLLTTDRGGRITMINPAGAAILGASALDLHGALVTDHLPVELHEEGEAIQGPNLRVEGVGNGADGRAFPVGYSATALRDAEDVVLGRLVVFTDLTELDELRRAADRAERLAALGRLAAGLAHEIRNPLGSIHGSVELVLEAPELESEDRRLLSVVLKEVDRLNDLVTNMLEVGRPRDPQPTAVDLGGLSAELVAMARGQGAGVALIRDGDDPVRAHADPAQLRQVLWNLLKNALQFSPPGGLVTVRVGWDDESRPQVAVEDEGPGIAADDQDHIFDMFFSKRRHGVGLGLALVRQIIEAHGGEVRLSSDSSTGSVFSVHLPPAQESGVTDGPDAEQPSRRG